MYNSPTTPTGTGRRKPSNTYVRAFPNGRPIGGPASSGPISGSTGATVVMTAASVGPYEFQTRAWPTQRDARSAVTRSAPTTQLPTPGTSAGSRRLSSDGTTLAAVTPVELISFA